MYIYLPVSVQLSAQDATVEAPLESKRGPTRESDFERKGRAGGFCCGVPRPPN